MADGDTWNGLGWLDIKSSMHESSVSRGWRDTYLRRYLGFRTAAAKKHVPAYSFREAKQLSLLVIVAAIRPTNESTCTDGAQKAYSTRHSTWLTAYGKRCAESFA